MFAGRYINLDRSPDRRALIEAELAKTGLADRYSRVVAYDGAAVTAVPSHPNRNDVACYLSHLAAIARREGADWLHVVEDDVYFSRHFPRIAELLTTDAAYADFDLIFTNIRPADDTTLASELRAVFDRCVEVDARGDVVRLTAIATPSLAQTTFWSATSYLVNPRRAGHVAALLADRLQRAPFQPIDTVMMQLSWSGDLRCACTVPFLTMSRLDLPSTITGPRPWAAGQRLRELALFADRDVAALREATARLHREAGASITAELMGEAHACIVQLGGDQRYQERPL